MGLLQGTRTGRVGSPLLGRLAFSLRKPLVDRVCGPMVGSRRRCYYFLTQQVCVCVFLSDAYHTKFVRSVFFSPTAKSWGAGVTSRALAK